MKTSKSHCYAVVAAVVFAAGISLSRADEQKGGDIPEAAMKEAQDIFNTRCSVCHGPLGKGDGPGSAALNPKPRNFTDEQWQKSVTDEHIEKIVQYGGIAVGKSPMMPGNPDLISKQDVVKALRAKVRQLGEHH